jgi:hypothetical protein
MNTPFRVRDTNHEGVLGYGVARRLHPLVNAIGAKSNKSDISLSPLGD